MVFAGRIEGLASTFDSYSLIRVADYQRNYDWGTREIDELFSDLELVVEKDEPHFFGSVIIQEGPRANQCELVDGQQRITTVFLVMARLRDESRKFESDKLKAKSADERDIYVTQPIENFLYGTGSATTKPRFNSNALLSELCNSALSPALDPDDSRGISLRSQDANREATLAFRKAYWHIRKIIAANLEKIADHREKLAYIHRLSRAIREQFKVLPITTEGLEESLSIFMTINDRGLPLGVFDLVRGQVLKARSQALKSDNARRDVFVKTLAEWDSILENVEGSKPDQFLRHHLLSDQNEKLTLKAVPTKAAEIIDPKKRGSETRAEKLWSGIQEASVVYDSLLRPRGTTATRYRLEALRFVADSYRILGLQLFRPDNHLSTAQVEKLTHLLFASVFAWNMSGGNAQELETALQGVSRKIREEKDFAQIYKSLLAILPTKVNVREFLDEGVSQSWTRAIYLAIESELSGKADYLDPRTLHIEHIAPQKSTPAWHKELKNSDQDYDKQVNLIGNLTILDSGLNMAIKQSEFPKKAKEYVKSRSNVATDLASLKRWNSELIVLRTDWVADSVEQLIAEKPGFISPFSIWLKNKVG